MNLNLTKLGHAVTYIKYLASLVSLTFLVKTLIWNKITFFASNSLNLADLMGNESMNSIYKKNLPIFQDLITKELDNFTKILISMVFD